MVATGLLLLALPLLLWPLLRPPGHEVGQEDGQETGEEAEEPARGAGRSQSAVQLSIEEVRLDLATGRIDQAEADRRISELRSESGGQAGESLNMIGAAARFGK